jgi:hypothetical protein
VRRDLAVAVEDHRVDDVGLLPHPPDVLLERGEVVEQQRAGRDGGEPAGERPAAPLDLVDDGLALDALDAQHHRGHREDQDQQRAQEQPALERAELEPRPRGARRILTSPSSHMRRSGSGRRRGH